ncbi:hypothetical protein JXD20_02815 [Candidatus Peregrinibacteria bacterium]|nr:hypothetical protein [Candidatus Peregrinibacteria bacterium]
MSEDYKKYETIEFFKEKYLVFRDKEKPPPTAAEVETGADQLLAKLRAKVDSNKKRPRKQRGGETAKKHPTPVHTRRADTREMYQPPARYEKSVEIAQQTVKLKGKMSPFEVRLMQAVHTNLYEQYMNPAFMHYLEQRGLTGQVYPVLERVIAHPEHFEYRSLGNNTVHIVKRRPETEDNADIPKDFVIVLKTKAGSIAKVNKVSLETEEGGIEWQTNEEYNQQMEHYRKRFWSEYNQKLPNEYWELDARQVYSEEEATEVYNRMAELMLKPYEKISQEMQVIFEMENITFPNRLLALIDARELPFEMNDPRIVNLRERMTKQGKNYTEITQQRDAPHNKLQVIVIQHPEVKGAYQIFMKPDNLEDYNNEEYKISVSKEGYLLIQDESGKWEVDPAYDDIVWRNYYGENQEAQVALSEAEQKELKTDEERIAKRKESVEAAKKERLRRKKAEAAIAKATLPELKPVVEAAIAKATLPELKKAAKTIAPAESHATIDAETNVDEMRKKFGVFLDHLESVRKIALALNVDYEGENAEESADESEKKPTEETEKTE